MKPLNNTVRNIEFDGTGETVDMTILADKSMFDLVIKNIYSRGHETIVRELIANAADAHIARYGAQRAPDITVDVTLPTDIDPVFKVRDKGLGMTHEFVMNNYRTLGYSSKSGSNEQTGMFGVGSKSPFSVTDTFTLKVFDSAESVRIYNIHVGASGKPQITYVFAAKPVAADRAALGGCEVSVPIARADKSKIFDGLRATHFVWFDKSVRFDGDTTAITALPKFQRLTDRLWMQTKAGFGPEVFIRQGSAIYPLDEDQVDFSYRDISDLFPGMRFYLDVPIGTFDVTASREQARYNAESIANLNRLLPEIVEEYRDLLRAEYAEAGSFLAYANKLLKSYSLPQAWKVIRFVVPEAQIPKGGYIGTAEQADRIKADKARYLDQINDPTTLKADIALLTRDLNKLPVLDAVMPKGTVINYGDISDTSMKLTSGRFNRPTATDIAAILPLSYIFVCTRRAADDVVDEVRNVIRDTAELKGRGSSVPIKIIRFGREVVELGPIITELAKIYSPIGVRIKVEGTDWSPVIRPKAPRVAPGASPTRTQAPKFDLSRGVWAGVSEIPVGLSYYVKSGKDVGFVQESFISELINLAAKQGLIDRNAPIYRLPLSRIDTVLKACPDMVELIPDLTARAETMMKAQGHKIHGLVNFGSRFGYQTVPRLKLASVQDYIKRDAMLKLAVATYEANRKAPDLMKGDDDLAKLAKHLGISGTAVPQARVVAEKQVQDHLEMLSPVIHNMMSSYGSEQNLEILLQAFFTGWTGSFPMPANLEDYQKVMDWYDTAKP